MIFEFIFSLHVEILEKVFMPFISWLPWDWWKEIQETLTFPPIIKVIEGFKEFLPSDLIPEDSKISEIIKDLGYFTNEVKDSNIPENISEGIQEGISKEGIQEGIQEGISKEGIPKEGIDVVIPTEISETDDVVGIKNVSLGEIILQAIVELIEKIKIELIKLTLCILDEVKILSDGTMETPIELRIIGNLADKVINVISEIINIINNVAIIFVEVLYELEIPEIKFIFWIVELISGAIDTIKTHLIPIIQEIPVIKYFELLINDIKVQLLEGIQQIIHYLKQEFLESYKFMRSYLAATCTAIFYFFFWWNKNE